MSGEMGKEWMERVSQGWISAAEQAAASTVLVDARKRLPGSGVAYSNHLILTADHVIEREENIRVLLADGSVRAASLAGRDPANDLALLRLEEAVLTPAETAETEGRVGQPALTVARPTPEGIQVGWALISAIGGPVRTLRGGLLRRYFRLDATPYPGFSGGALVDLNGRLLGINTSGLAGGTFLSIPAAVAWEIAEVLARHGRIRRGYLGIRSQPVEIPPALQQALHRAQERGLLLMSVEEGTPAAEAGLMVGDILAAINAQPLNDPEDLVSALSADVVGKVVTLELLRGGQRIEKQASVGER
ncbi:MAG: S1C family serine protease [Bellilinea sp.]|nr:S1C family serine protease [Bellilinea sp.]